jgi:carbonic anhydrase
VVPELDRILDANRYYREHPEFRVAPRTPRPGRRLVVLTCMDARLDLFRALGLEVGDAHLLRNAGGRATDDALRSLALSTKVLGTREIGVVHHDDCGLHGQTNEELRERTGATVDFLPFDDLDGSVIDDVDAVRRCPWLPEDAVVWGAVYDVDDGGLRVVVPPT